MIRVEILEAPFDLAREVEVIASAGVGAVATFSGYVRGDDGIVAIELEHYPAMTGRVLTELAEHATRRWYLSGCTVLHRVGRLSVGEAIVLVAVASPHRAEALEACSYLIDRLKTDAPFWKKEIRPDGRADWVAAKLSDLDRSANWDEM